MKILILGSSGFIGKNLVRHFQQSDHEILAPKRQELDLINQNATKAYFAKHQPDIVINTAINIQSTEINLAIFFNIESCHRYYKKLINIGSGAEYSSKHYTPLMRETYFGENIPLDTYGISKYSIARDIEKSQNNCINLRVFGIFGEHEDHSRRFISNNICSSIRNNTIKVNQNSKFDYIDILDFSRIIEKFLDKDTTHKSYNICTARSHELTKLASIIDSVSGQKNSILILNDNLHMEYSGDNQRMIAEIGEFEFTAIEKSISRLFDWYRTEFNEGRIT